MLSHLATAISLRHIDDYWERALNGSLLVGIGARIKSILSSIDGESLRRLGSFLQSASFYVALLLFTSLAMPQFANDKNVLAVVCLSGFGMWMLGYLIGGKESRRSNAVDILVLLFFAANIVAACASHYFLPSLHGLSKLVVYICSYFFLTTVLNTPRKKFILVSALVAAAVGVCLYGIYSYMHGGQQPLATWEDPTVETQGIRLYSTLGNPNLLAGYLIPLFALALGLTFSAFSNFKGRVRFLLAAPALVAAAILGGSTILTGSRGGYIAIGLAAATISAMAVAKVWIAKPKLRAAIVVVCVVLPLLLLVGLHFVPSFEQRLTSIFAGREHSSNSFRMNVWQSSIRMFLDNWWFGIGTGNQAFILAYGLYMRSGFDALGTYCVPLEIAVETGIVGLSFFVILLLSLLGRAHLSFWSPLAHADKWLTAGAVAALIDLMAHGMVDTVFYRPQVQFLFWLMVALIVTDAGSNRDSINAIS